MSTWHETQIEFAYDEADELIANHPDENQFVTVRGNLSKAYHLAENLPEDNPQESINRLQESIQFLTKAEDALMAEVHTRKLHKKIQNAKKAVQKTIPDYQADL